MHPDPHLHRSPPPVALTAPPRHLHLPLRPPHGRRASHPGPSLLAARRTSTCRPRVPSARRLEDPCAPPPSPYCSPPGGPPRASPEPPLLAAGKTFVHRRSPHCSLPGGPLHTAPEPHLTRSRALYPSSLLRRRRPRLPTPGSFPTLASRGRSPPVGSDAWPLPQVGSQACGLLSEHDAGEPPSEPLRSLSIPTSRPWHSASSDHRSASPRLPASAGHSAPHLLLHLAGALTQSSGRPSQPLPLSLSSVCTSNNAVCYGR